MSSSFIIFLIIGTAFVAVSFFLFSRGRTTRSKREDTFQWGSGRGPINRVLPHLIIILLIPLLANKAAEENVQLTSIIFPSIALALFSFINLMGEE